MKERITTAAAFAACLALCAAVWPQDEPAEETPAPPMSAAVIATQPEVPEIPEIKKIIMTEKEKTDVTQSESIREATTEPEPTPTQMPRISEAQATPEQNTTPPQDPEPTPVSPDGIPDNMVYVPGFGWIESQGPNHVEYAEDMYENGNKIGRMN